MGSLLLEGEDEGSELALGVSQRILFLGLGCEIKMFGGSGGGKRRTGMFSSSSNAADDEDDPYNFDASGSSNFILNRFQQLHFHVIYLNHFVTFSSIFE